MSEMKRRDVLRYSAAGAVTAATALVGTQAALAGPDATSGERNAAAPKKDPRDFEENYKGKRIRGRHFGVGRDELLINNKKLALTAISTLFFPEDGSEPYVAMGYISAINHYDPVEIDDPRDALEPDSLNPNLVDPNIGGQNKRPEDKCLRKLGRKVVDILGGLELTDQAAQAHQH